MKEPIEVPVLLCSSLEELKESYVPAEKSICMLCKQKVWLCHSSVSRVLNDLGKEAMANAEILCLKCGFKKLEEEKDSAIIVPPSKEQLGELKEALWKNHPDW